MHRTALAAFAACLVTLPALAQTVPTGFVVDTLLTNLSTPNDCCFLPDGRCLIANSAGSVVVYVDGGPSGAVGTVPNVESGGERGLLSIAADPNFATTGYVYVYYSSTLDSYMHLDRFTCTGDLANPSSTTLSFAGSSRCVVLGVIPDFAGNHNGGSTRFGPDGKLYQTIGDDAVMCNAQILTSQSGCLLRLDVSGLPVGASTTLPTYSSLDPGDNPNSAATDFSQLVIAHGLRNPFRAEIDPATGSIYIGDVGNATVEEYSEYVYPATGPLPLVNFGWPWREGNIAGSSCGGTQPPGLVDPIATATHGQGWQSIMGGARYRNVNGVFDFGPNYEGNAFFLDYYAGQLRRLVEAGGVWAPAPAVPGQPSPTNWGTGFGSVTSLRLGPDGALWLTQHGSMLKRVRLLGPVNSVEVVSGGGQVVPAGEAFPEPLVVRVLDASGNPLPGGSVNFSAAGGATISTTNPVIADANGLAQTTATSAGATGGGATISATTPGGITTASFSLFGRKIRALPAGNLLVLTVSNTTTSNPPVVPYIVMAAIAGAPPLPTFLGPLCTDPFSGLTFVMEDGTGAFGFYSLSGTGGVGSPNLTKIYTLPTGLLTGLQIHFQALGFDAVTGLFRTDCDTRQF